VPTLDSRSFILNSAPPHPVRAVDSRIVGGDGLPMPTVAPRYQSEALDLRQEFQCAEST
jgi:hypothetical protein